LIQALHNRGPDLAVSVHTPWAWNWEYLIKRCSIL